MARYNASMRHRRLLVSLAIVSVIVLVMGIALLRDHRYINLAVGEFAAAQAFGSTSPTYQDAKDWLESNGFHVVITGGGNFVSEVTRNTDAPERFMAVFGYKRLGSGVLGIGSRWMHVAFCFTEDDAFLRVEVDPTSNPPPRWSVPKGQRPPP
jgi:hypothetical protein